MRNWKISPKNTIVAKYVDCYWLLEKTEDDLKHKHPKLPPDPAAHIIMSRPEQPYEYSLSKRKYQGQGNHIILPHRQTFLMNHTQPFLIMGIKLKVGAAYSLAFENSLDKVVDLKRRSQYYFEFETLSINAMSDAKSYRDYFDAQLQPILLEAFNDKHSQLTREIIPLLTETTLCEIGNTLHCSQRTIERNFLRVTGFTLKQYDSMRRLEILLDYLYQQKAHKFKWADIAIQFGFSDQPHLIRYLKSSIGNTPGKYIQTRDLTIDAYGDFA